MAISFIGKVSNGKTIEVYPNVNFFEGIGSALTFIFGLIAVFIATRALGAKSEGPRCFEIVVGIVKFAVIIGAVLGRIIIQSATSGSLSVEPSATQAEVSSGASSAFESGSVVSPDGTGHPDVFAKQGSMKDVGKNSARFDAFTELGWAIDRSKMVSTVAACLEIDGRIVGNLDTHIGRVRSDVAAETSLGPAAAESGCSTRRINFGSAMRCEISGSARAA